jgi:hypothetical protein
MGRPKTGADSDRSHELRSFSVGLVPNSSPRPCSESSFKFWPYSCSNSSYDRAHSRSLFVRAMHACSVSRPLKARRTRKVAVVGRSNRTLNQDDHTTLPFADGQQTPQTGLPPEPNHGQRAKGQARKGSPLDPRRRAGASATQERTSAPQRRGNGKECVGGLALGLDAAQLSGPVTGSSPTLES